MLAELIKSITTSADRPDIALWDFRISGNILELSVIPDYNTNPDKYRMGIIQAGQVLYAIERLAVSSGQLAQIQSFPNIEASQLVALVRLHRSYDSFHKTHPNGLHQDLNTPVITLLKSIASHYGLFFQNQNGKELSRLLDIFHTDQKKIESGGYFYSLCSTMDNPFLWLKTGQWIERVNQLIKENSSISAPDITFNLSKEKRESLNRAFPDCSYVQAIVHLQHR